SGGDAADIERQAGGVGLVVARGGPSVAASLEVGCAGRGGRGLELDGAHVDVGADNPGQLSFVERARGESDVTSLYHLAPCCRLLDGGLVGRRRVDGLGT